ncbi:histidine--tRNA ligase [Elusimicrobiota bacterium]
MEPIRKVRGIRDIVFPESAKWDEILRISRNLLRSYGYRSIYLPVIEFSNLFSRAIGEDTDIVLKEMYNFKDRKGRDLSLRPEGTASAARALIEQNVFSGSGSEKIFYFGPMFRYERPQEGRYRQFHQFGCEAYGEKSPSIDAEIVGLAVGVLLECKVGIPELQVNSVGCRECRSEYKKTIKKSIGGKLSELCDDCRRRFDTNTLRIFDCKNEKCQDIYKDLPGFSESLCASCKEYFDEYRKYLDEMQFEYRVNSRLVRGLDYYTGPVFEIDISGSTLIAGGRYDNLIKQLGGPDVPACGWAFGMERLSELSCLEDFSSPQFYFATMGDIKKSYILRVLEKFRDPKDGLDYAVEADISDVKIAKKMKNADKKGYQYVILIGEDEAENEKIQIKNLRTGVQTEFSVNDNELSKKIDGMLEGTR